MKLWVLKPVKELPKNDNPWNPWYDKAFGFVVRAETKSDARILAHANAGDENHDMFLGGRVSNTTSPWLDANYTSCIELLPSGKAEVILRDFASA